MHNDDDLSKTMLIPNPGGRRSYNAQHDELSRTRLSPTAAGAGAYSATGPAATDIAGENILLSEARDIISLASHLRTLAPSNSIEQLRLDVENLFRQFSNTLKEQGTTDEVMLTARYQLCCLIDELVLSTPWGIDSPWSQQTLLSKYHNETSGGEKFFLIANKLMEHPQRNLDLIELAYVCLSLGFRGKYRLSQTSDSDINNICQMLYQPIALYRPVAADLSPCWQAAPALAPSIEKRIPPTLLLLFLSFICVAVFIGLLSNLNAKASPLLAKIEAIAWDELLSNASEQSRHQTGIDEVVSQLRNALQPSIAAHKVTVATQDNMVVIRLISDALFPPGSTKISEAELPNLNTLVQAISAYANSVIIVGHTDSTGRAESNWTISRLRAEAIENWLHSTSPTIKNSITRGMADTQPLVSGRDASENRRVELLLLPKE